MSMENLEQIFENKFDCYGDAQGDVVIAMTKDAFVEVVGEILENIKQDLLQVVISGISSCSEEYAHISVTNSYSGGIVHGKLEVYNKIFDLILEKSQKLD